MKDPDKEASGILAEYLQPGARHCQATVEKLLTALDNNDVAEAMIESDEMEHLADDLTNRGPQDRSRINISEDYEVRYWTKELGVSADELKRLVGQHGNSADAIRKAIGRT
jgi:uncharacterized protein DUF3606